MKAFQIINDDGVSEAIGFIIIFGLVMTGIALITLYGYPMLLQQQSNADVRNMEQTMVVLQNDIKSLCYKSVPYKETSLQVAGGVLTMENATATGKRFNISVIKNDGTINTTELFSPGAFVYTADSQDATLALENGAVIRAQAGGSSMIAEPRWYIDTNNGEKTFVINLVALNASTEMSRNGMGTVRMKLNNSTVSSLNLPKETVAVSYTSTGEFSRAWENYLTGTLKMNKSGDNTYTLGGVDRLIVKKYEVQVLGI
ncbi:hypothetical protein E2N92_08610 [Methanofollis formosanus]|uniref:Uncharacterized protein n=1 Tax=Methanofollis formosanus TaxID=299308 RepID=A0A8G1EG55_9EURY|nr:hypothetical protein [Methanofollis formosanus]QYZ79483.1 hypothetical protein E2N92_08610 [Methanofollis formosanus]